MSGFDPLDIAQNDETNWTDTIRKEIAEKSSAIITKPDWEKRTISALKDEMDSDKNFKFYTIALVADALGIDTWDYYYERQKSGHGDCWYQLMKTKNEAKIDKIVALAEQIIPLDQVATGPEQEIGMSLKFKYHNALECIIQALCNFPGKGWILVKTNLHSPVIRNRNISLRALSKWGKDNWPEDAETILQEALKIEPNNDVKQTMQKVITGESID